MKATKPYARGGYSYNMEVAINVLTNKVDYRSLAMICDSKKSNYAEIQPLAQSYPSSPTLTLPRLQGIQNNKTD